MAKQKGAKGRKPGKQYSSDEKGRAERFVDFGQKRVSKTIKAIRQVANLSNKASYHYTDEQVKRMFVAILDSLKAAEARFSAKAKEKGQEFTF